MSRWQSPADPDYGDSMMLDANKVSVCVHVCVCVCVCACVYVCVCAHAEMIMGIAWTHIR